MLEFSRFFKYILSIKKKKKVVPQTASILGFTYLDKASERKVRKEQFDLDDNRLGDEL